MRDDDMTGEHPGHPQDLLATYVDGEASEAERAEVDALLSACRECRMEVDLAVQARAALQSLPHLNAPTLRVEALATTKAPAARQPASTGRAVLARVREWSWDRVAWGAGLVAAGSLVALFVLVQSSGGPSQRAAAPEAARGRAQQPLEAPGGSGPNYTPASLDALAKRLVASERTTLGFQEQQTPAPAAVPKRSQQPTADVGDRARDCLRRGGGLPPRARPTHVEEAAFRGVPAFIGAFESGSPGGGRYLLVLAVDHRTCDALYVINRSL
jgi:anti-sigma factor RsiW